MTSSIKLDLHITSSEARGGDSTGEFGGEPFTARCLRPDDSEGCRSLINRLCHSLD